MSDTLKEAIKNYLRESIPDNERVVRAITRNIKKDFPILSKTDVNRILYKDNNFTSKKKFDNHKVYWYLTDEDRDVFTDEEQYEPVYLFVDCDNSPTTFYDFINRANSCENFYLRGYSGPCYNTSRVGRYMDTSDDESVVFYKSDVTYKDAADVAILFDLHHILIDNPYITAFVVSGDNVFFAGIAELCRRFPESDLSNGRDSQQIRYDIEACI